MNQLFKMAFRDLGRNKRRSILSALAVSIATTLLIFMASVVRGEFRGALQNGIRLQTGHLQVRAAPVRQYCSLTRRRVEPLPMRAAAAPWQLLAAKNA